MTAMLIRCKQIRTLPNGTKGSNIDMGDGTIIPFREDENGDHVAMVSNPKHLQRLLSIVEGYEIHAMPEPVAAPADATDLSALDEDQIRAVYEAELKRKPHHNAKRETMVAQIEALRAEAAK